MLLRSTYPKTVISSNSSNSSNFQIIWVISRRIYDRTSKEKKSTRFFHMLQGILEFPRQFPGLRETFASVVRLEVPWVVPEFVVILNVFIFFLSAITLVWLHLSGYHLLLRTISHSGVWPVLPPSRGGQVVALSSCPHKQQTLSKTQSNFIAVLITIITEVCHYLQWLMIFYFIPGHPFSTLF